MLIIESVGPGASLGSIAPAGRLRSAGPRRHVAEPTLTREGNWRFAALASLGYPVDPWGLTSQVLQLLEGQEIEPYGPPCVLFSLPPTAAPFASAECQVGTAITGLGRSRGPLVVEDYRQLIALSLPHPGPIRELPMTWERLAAAAAARGATPRPYWRVALRTTRMADGNLLPRADVAVFLDR